VPGAGEVGSLACFALCGFILRGLGYATIHRVVSQIGGLARQRRKTILPISVLSLCESERQTEALLVLIRRVLCYAIRLSLWGGDQGLGGFWFSQIRIRCVNWLPWIAL